MIWRPSSCVRFLECQQVKWQFSTALTALGRELRFRARLCVHARPGAQRYGNLQRVDTAEQSPNGDSFATRLRWKAENEAVPAALMGGAIGAAVVPLWSHNLGNVSPTTWEKWANVVKFARIKLD